MRKIIKKLAFIFFPSIAVVGSLLTASCGELPRYDIYLITGGGPIRDKSFNEQSTDAVLSFATVNKLRAIAEQPYSSQAMQDYYNAALYGKAKMVVLSGSQHLPYLTPYLQNPDIVQRIENEGAQFILVDGSLQPNLSALPFMNSIKYRSEQSGFFAGYSTSVYLMAKYNTTQTFSNRKAGVYGARAGNLGIAAYMNGFAYGVAAANADDYLNSVGLNVTGHSVQLLNPTDGKDILADGSVIPTSIWNITGTGANAVFNNMTNAANPLANSSAFFSNSFSDDAGISAKFISEGAKIIFPVNGPAVQSTINAILNWKPAADETPADVPLMIGTDWPLGMEKQLGKNTMYVIGTAFKNITSSVKSLMQTKLNNSQAPMSSWCNNNQSIDTNDFNNNICETSILTRPDKSNDPLSTDALVGFAINHNIDSKASWGVLPSNFGYMKLWQRMYDFIASKNNNNNTTWWNDLQEGIFTTSSLSN